MFSRCNKGSTRGEFSHGKNKKINEGNIKENITRIS